MSSSWPRPILFLKHYATLLLTDPRYFTILALFVVLGDVALTQLIIRFVPYTEIDWETYIYQLELYLDGERDYGLIEGPTGPLVYPAGHLYIHRILYGLTNAGKNVYKAQQIYGTLYIVSLALTCTIYRTAGNVPNWVLLLLPLSKRLHSIFALRLFNDCWSVVASQASVLAFALGNDALGTLLLGGAISVKMSALLYLPGVLVVLFKRRGPLLTAGYMFILAYTQIALGWPFLTHNHRSYLKCAYEFTRAFLYKWTVNWRFVPEDVFLSPTWARSLLCGHLTALVAFGLFRWCKRDGGVLAVLNRGLKRPTASPALVPLTADYVTTVLFTSNLVGILFARSLHYQFYSWYAHQIPFLLWRTKYPVWIKLPLLFGVEYAWNVFPSTVQSSGVLCATNFLLVVGVFFGYPEGRTVKLLDKKFA